MKTFYEITNDLREFSIGLADEIMNELSMGAVEKAEKLNKIRNRSDNFWLYLIEQRESIFDDDFVKYRKELLSGKRDF